MRKISVVILSLFMLIVVLSACGTTENENFTVLTTNFAIYDWAKNVAGDAITVKLLIEGGSDVHSYQPSVKDIAEIATCDAFIYVGGESDEWVTDALKNKSNEDRAVLSLLDSEAFTAYKEELAEGMEGEEEDAIDEHIWLSLRVAAECTRRIAELFSDKLPEYADKFSENAEKYIDELKKLDEDFSEKIKLKTLVFADRFPFRYFTEDYVMDYYAPFAGCSAETEASAATVAFLTNKVDELDAKYVFVLTGNNKKLAKTIAPNAEILTLSSIENISVKDNTSYIKLMSQNMETILRAN